MLDLEWMQEAYRLTRKDGAPGIDGVTAVMYETNLEANLSDLLERIRSGRYCAPPVSRTHIPKGGRLEAGARYPELRVHGGAAGRGHGIGTDLRAGLL